MTEKDLISRWDEMSANHKSDVFKLLADAVSSSYDLGHENGYRQGRLEQKRDDDKDVEDYINSNDWVVMTQKEIRADERKKCVDEINHIFMMTHPNQLINKIAKWIKENRNVN